MYLNWNPERVAFLDFETQSDVDLGAETLQKYVEHPSTRALTCCVKIDGIMHRMGPLLSDTDLALLDRISDTHVLVAHNAPFDAAVWEKVLHLPPVEWFDTLPCARCGALPGGLDKLGEALTGQGKDPNGKRLIDMLCKPNRQRPPLSNPAYFHLLQYNARDTELLEQVYHLVRPFTEPAVMTVDRTVNDRGIPVDREYLARLRELFHENAKRARQNFLEVTGDGDVMQGVNPQSGKQVMEWMRKKGVEPPQANGKDSLNKFAVKTMLAKPGEYFIGDGDEDAAISVVTEALELRREAVRVGKGKADSAWDALERDDRLRDLLVYGGGHTMRWTSRRLQLHNMPKAEYNFRDVEPTQEAIDAAVAEASAALGKPVMHADVLGGMLRGMVRADNLLVADYASIEAKCLAWLAEEQRMLDIYSDPNSSIYLDMAEKLFGRRIDKKKDSFLYDLSKSIVLGCGYGMSGFKFEYTMKMRDIDSSALAAVGLTAADAVKAYRTAYPKIPNLWKVTHDAVHAAVNGHASYACKCHMFMSGPNLHVVLPSGRVFLYRNAKVEPKVPAYCAFYGMDPVAVPTVVFTHPRGYTGFLYGSKLVENIDQAICRDLLAEALVHCEQDGLNPVLHVHDEVVCEKEPKHLERFMSIMSEVPSWAKGFPVTCEGYSGPLWTKNPKGYKECISMNGRILQ